MFVDIIMKSFKYCVYFVMTLSVLSLLANAKIISTDEDEFVYTNRIAIFYDFRI